MEWDVHLLMYLPRTKNSIPLSQSGLFNSGVRPAIRHANRKRPVESLYCYIFEDTVQSAFTHSWLNILDANEDNSCSFSYDSSIQYPDSFQFIFGVFGVIKRKSLVSISSRIMMAIVKLLLQFCCESLMSSMKRNCRTYAE